MLIGGSYAKQQATKRRAQKYQEGRESREKEKDNCTSTEVGSDGIRETGVQGGETEKGSLNSYLVAQNHAAQLDCVLRSEACLIVVEIDENVFKFFPPRVDSFYPGA